MDCLALSWDGFEVVVDIKVVTDGVENFTAVVSFIIISCPLQCEIGTALGCGRPLQL